MSRRARTRRDKRAPQPDFDDDTTAAYGGLLPFETEVSLQGFACSFVLPLAGCKLNSDLIGAVGF